MAHRSLCDSVLGAHPCLLERALASPSRRICAHVIDFMILLIPSLIIIISAAILSLHVTDPTGLQALKTIFTANSADQIDADTELGALYTDLDTLLTRSDYVVLCPPLNDQTRGMIGRPELARMQDTATLVNIGRGPLVDTAARPDALQNGEIYSAGLDVTDPEPLPRDHPLLRLKNVTISPHLGSATEQTRELMANISVENLFAGMRGSALTHQVNRQPEPE